MSDGKKPAARVGPWQVLESKYSYGDRWLAVRSDTVRVPNGTILSPYHTIVFPECICAIALTPEREILLVENRHGVGRPPRAAARPEHDGEVTPRRETRALEVAAHECACWPVDRQHCPPGTIASSFLALDARKVADQKLDAGEVIEVHAVAWETFLADLAEGRLEIPGLHLAALWQLSTFARKTRDPRLRALGL
jgi:hypothetical protein